jgi:hypothetical protein
MGFPTMSTRPAEELGVEPPPSLVGTVLAGRYRVDGLLGEGGMGRVYLAEHVLMLKPVALKVLHPELTAIPDVVSRFEREAVAAARIDHPNVAQALDCGRLEDGSLYFALEYVAGRSLRAVLDEGAMGLERTLSIARQTATAMVAAHAVGIVHRDLKPDNVMLVAQPGGADRVKVLDFGIAKVSSEGVSGAPAHTLTRIGVVMGTAGYMSPEQALGQAVDHHADLYAFGVMLFEMLAGRRPFEAEEVAQILAKQLTEEPPPLPADTPADLARLVYGLLAKTPSERVPSSAAELVTALDALAERRALVGATTALLDAPPPSALSATSNEPHAAPSARVAVARTHVEPAGVRRPARFTAAAAVLVVAGIAVARWRNPSTTPEAAPGASGAAPTVAAPNGKPVESTVTSASSAVPTASARVTEAARGPTAPTPVRPEAEATTPERSNAASARAGTSDTTSREQGTVTKETREHGGATTETTTRERGGVTRTRKTKQSREEHTVKRKRRTGPGGIYIPPPNQWFK